MRRVIPILILLAALVPAMALAGKDDPPPKDSYWLEKNQEVMQLFAEKNYEKAEAISDNLLKYLDKKGLGDSAEASITLNNLGMLYFFTERYVKSHEALQQCLDMRIKLYGKVHPDVVLAYKNLADVTLNMARFYRAKMEATAKELNAREGGR